MERESVTERWMMIDNVKYDVTEFQKKHPGGGIIKFYDKMDATEAFQNFHYRSKKAKKVLQSLPVIENTDVPFKNKELYNDYKQLKNELEAEGFFKHSKLHVLYRFFELAFMFSFGAYICLQFNQWIIGLSIIGIAQGRCGWLMHEAGHYSLTSYMPLDRVLNCFLFAWGCGMSGSYWQNQHNKHHATPQKMDHDVDLKTLPLVAFNKKIYDKLPKGHFFRPILKLQSFLFMPMLTPLVAYFWHLYRDPVVMFRTKKIMEMFWYVVRLVSWYFFLRELSWGGMFGAYFFSLGFGGMYIFTNFAVSHTHLDVVAKDDKNINWVEYSSQYTMNIHQSWYVDWWMAYLNFQIEHHLFPQMPQYRFGQVSPRVQALFKKHNIPYLRMHYAEAVGVTLNNLYSVVQ